MAKDDSQTSVFRLGLGQATEHNHRQPWVKGSDLPHQLGSATARHEVIGYEHADAVRQHAQRRQGAFRGGGNRNLEARGSQDSFANA